MTSCKDSESKNEEKVMETSDANTEPNEVVECLTLNTEIYRETATMWEQSWESKHSGKKSPIITFSKVNLDKLQSQNTARNPDYSGLRMYYILLEDVAPNTIPIPALGLVNLDNCRDQTDCDNEGECFLISYGREEDGFVTSIEFQEARDRWEKIYDRNVNYSE